MDWEDAESGFTPETQAMLDAVLDGCPGCDDLDGLDSGDGFVQAALVLRGDLDPDDYDF